MLILHRVEEVSLRFGERNFCAIWSCDANVKHRGNWECKLAFKSSGSKSIERPAFLFLCCIMHQICVGGPHRIHARPEPFLKVCPPVASCVLSWLKLLARRCISSSYRFAESFVHMRTVQGTLVKAFGSKNSCCARLWPSLVTLFNRALFTVPLVLSAPDTCGGCRHVFVTHLKFANATWTLRQQRKWTFSLCLCKFHVASSCHRFFPFGAWMC